MNTIAKENFCDDNSHEFIGNYYFSDLWEIHATFKHYRCENFANRVRTSSSSSCIESSGIQRQNVINENDCTQSAPPSPKTELKPIPQKLTDFVEKPKRLYQKNQSNSTSSLGGFIKKITRLRRQSSKPWIVMNIETHDSNGTKASEVATPLSQFDVMDKQCSNFNKPSHCCTQRSKSETKIAKVDSTHRKSLQDLKTKNEKPNQDQTRRDLRPFKAPKSWISSYTESINNCNVCLSPKRSVNPPKSLDLKDKIVVIHSQQIERSFSNMTSIDSIGSCSLDIHSDKPTLPPTHTPRSISEHTLKSATILEDNINKLNGKSPSLHMLKNGHRIPSYVGISCAISGYSNYNRYCSSLRNTCSRENSPTLKYLSQEPVKHLNEFRKNSLISETLITSSHNQLQTNGNEELLHLKHNEQLLQLKHNNVKSNELNTNSLLQQRIASLYGETFAADWRQSRTKSRVKQNNSSIIDKIRSPSCPPNRNNDSDISTHSECEPEFDRIATQIVEQLEAVNRESPNIEDSLMKPVTDHEVVPSSQTTSLNGNSLNGNSLSGNSLSGNSLSGNSLAQTRASTLKDGNWFLSELSKTTIDLKQKIDLTEEMLRQQQQSMTEDISGKLRAAIGKANLLITQKFNQFRELCLKNISQTDCEPFKTTNDDLEGFWDMVSIQVIDIRETFDEINALHASGWKSDLPKKMPTFSPSKPRSKRSTPKGSPDKSCDESSSSSSDRDLQRRNRLKEAKRKAKLNAAKNDDEITIFIPSNSKE